MPTKPGPAETRHKPRIGLDAEITMRRAGFPNFRVQIDDISTHGCRIEFVDRPAIDERVWIKLDGLASLEGCVAWVREHSAGIKFDQPMHPAVFEDLVTRLR